MEGRPRIPIDTDRLRELAPRLPLWRLSEEFGCSVSTLRHRLREMGIRLKPRAGGKPGRPRSVNIPPGELRGLLQEGYSIIGIAKYYGCSHTTAETRVRELREQGRERGVVP